MSKDKMTRAEMLGNYPYAPNGIDTVVARKGTIVDLPERHFKIAKGKGLAKAAEKGAKTEADHAADKAEAVAEKSAAAIAVGGEEALQKITDNYDGVVEALTKERDALSEKLLAISAHYEGLIKIVQDNVPADKLKELEKADFGKQKTFLETVKGWFK